MRWGILATGTIAEKFADTVNRMEDQELIACASRTMEKAEAFQKKHGIKKAYDSYEDMIKDQELDAVYIATPNHMHYENAVMCLNGGKHVLCEKPFTVSRKEGEALFQLAEEKNLFIMEAFWTRFIPALRKLQDAIEEGVIGDLMFARSEFGFVAKGARKDRKFDSSMAGGTLLDIGIYNLGLMRMIMGCDPESFSSEYHINEYGTDDYHSLLLRYPGGKTASVTAAIGLYMPRKAMVCGTKGTVFLEDYQIAESFTVCPDGEPSYTVEVPLEINGFEYQIREVDRCTALGMNTSDILTKEHTLNILGLMEEIRESWNMKFKCE